jgi:hypothetical protein
LRELEMVRRTGKQTERVGLGLASAWLATGTKALLCCSRLCSEGKIYI